MDIGYNNDERQGFEATSDGEQTHTSASIILSQTDLNYIIDTVGEISNDEIQNYYVNTSICENKTPQPILKNDNNEESAHDIISTVHILSCSES